VCCCFRLDAVVGADARETPAMDDEEARRSRLLPAGETGNLRPLRGPPLTDPPEEKTQIFWTILDARRLTRREIRTPLLFAPERFSTEGGVADESCETAHVPHTNRSQSALPRRT
jgi:hypothetical protein